MTECDIDWWINMQNEYWYAPIASLGLYGFLLCWPTRPVSPGSSFCFGAWNATLALLSLVGVTMAFPTLLYNVQQSMHHTICAPMDIYACGPSGTAIGAFSAVSKIVELGDTVWLVARGRPVRFLHWYHHASVLAFSWYALKRRTGILGLWFGTVNMFIHTIMYAYYAWQAFGASKWLRRYAFVITVMQITQMLLGTALIVIGSIYSARGIPCAIDPSIACAGALMYMSYTLLFIRLYRDSYRVRKETMKIA